MNEIAFSYPAYEIGKLSDALDGNDSHIHLADGYLNKISDCLENYKNELGYANHKPEMMAVLAIIVGITYPIQELRVYFEEHREGTVSKRVKKKVARSHLELITKTLDDLNTNV